MRVNLPLSASERQKLSIGIFYGLVPKRGGTAIVTYGRWTRAASRKRAVRRLSGTLDQAFSWRFRDV